MNTGLARSVGLLGQRESETTAIYTHLNDSALTEGTA